MALPNFWPQKKYINGLGTDFASLTAYANALNKCAADLNACWVGNTDKQYISGAINRQLQAVNQLRQNVNWLQKTAGFVLDKLNELGLLSGFSQPYVSAVAAIAYMGGAAAQTRIKLDTSAVRAAANTLNHRRSALVNCQSNFVRAKTAIDPFILGMWGIGTSVGASNAQMDALLARHDKIVQAIHRAAERYDAADLRLKRKAEAIKAAGLINPTLVALPAWVQDLLKGFGNGKVGSSKSVFNALLSGLFVGAAGGGIGADASEKLFKKSGHSTLLAKYLAGELKIEDPFTLSKPSKKGESMAFWRFLGGDYEAGITPEGKAKYIPTDWKQKWKELDTSWGKDEVWDKETGQMSIPSLTKFAKNLGGLSLFNASAQVGGSLFEAGAEGKGEYAQGKVSVKVGTVEAHAGISGGLYGYDKDGKLVIAPAIKAEMGASACLFKAEAEGRIGLGENNDMLGAYGKGEVSAGKLEAKAGIDAALFTEKGPQLRGKASAEAIAGEAKGSVGVTVLGADIGVSGSVNYGIGAHADVGLVDGKVKVDIGATVGLGFSVGFEVDVGGTVNAVAGAVDSGWKALKGLFGG